MPKRELATREHHPALHVRSTAPGIKRKRQHKSVIIPHNETNVELEVSGRVVRLTNLRKLFWPKLGITKRDLLQYYADVARVLLPHLADRAMVMKRYPNGAAGEFFFMKRIPQPHPDWIEICSIEHSSGNIIDFPIVQDLPSLLWTINLGCIDLNQWYASCDDVDRPDCVHFDLDPVRGATFEKVVEASLVVRDALESLKMSCYAKTTGSRGIHVYVPILRGPTQKQVWGFAKELANAVAAHAPKLLIMDEPTTGLDIRERFRLLRLIERLRSRVSIVFSTHQPADVASVCDQVLILRRGRAVAYLFGKDSSGSPSSSP